MLNKKSILFFIDEEKVLGYFVSPRSQKIIDSFYEIIDPHSSSITSLMKKALLSFNYQQHHLVSIFLTSPSSIIKEISLPQDENLTSDILRLNIDRFTPFSEKDVSFLSMPSDSPNKKTLFAIPQKKIKTLSDSLFECKVPQAHISFFEWTYTSYLNSKISSFNTKNSLLIQSDSSQSIRISIFSKGIIRVSKNISFSIPTTLPSKDFEDPDWHNLVKEIQPLIKYYTVIIKGAPLKSLSIWGTNLNYDEVYSFLCEQLNLYPDKITFPESPYPTLAQKFSTFLFKQTKETPSSFFIRNLSLLTNKKNIHSALLTFLQTIFMILLLTTLFFSTSRLSHLRNQIHVQQKQIKSIQKITLSLSEKKKNFKLLNNYNGSELYLKILSSITSQFHTHSILQSLQINHDATFDLILHTQDKNKIETILKSHKSFQNTSITFQKDDPTTPSPSHITLTLQGSFTRDLTHQYGQ